MEDSMFDVQFVTGFNRSSNASSSRTQNPSKLRAGGNDGSVLSCPYFRVC